MAHRLVLGACIALAGSAGCKGCSDRLPGGAAIPAPQVTREAQSAHERVMARVAARKLNRDKVYPNDAQGAVLCEADVDCFLIQAERCSPATLTHRLVYSGYGMDQRVNARYRIDGSEADRCKIDRQVLALDTEVNPVMREALRKRGKSDAEIEKIESDALTALQRAHPAHQECFFDGDGLLATLLDLADGRFATHAWRSACRTVDGPAPATGSAAAPAPEPGAAAPPE
jgi:hypothetical protein